MGKKRIAKHVLDAQDKNKKEGLLETSSEVQQHKKKKRRKSKKRCHVKDPKEAHSYLSLWQQQQKEDNDVKLWSFNTNTQSWLIRHMYDVDKIPKGPFTTMVLYLEALKGSSRQRVQKDAVRRALRYKEWEKKNQGNEKKKDEVDSERNEEAVTKNPDDAGDNQGDDDDDDDVDDDNDKMAEEKRWGKLSDNDKRKEYKRARKVVDALKSDEKE